MRLRVVQVVAFAACAGCGRLDFGLRGAMGGGGGDDLPAGDGGGPDGAGNDGLGIDAPPDFGSGTISGTGCQGTAFSTIGAAYVLGNVPSPGELEIVQFDSAVRCDEISTQGWDHAADTFTGTVEYLSIETGGDTTGQYQVSFIEPPAAGSAFGTFYDVTWPGPSSSTSCTSGSAPTAGSVTTRVNADGSVDSTYSMQIQTGGTLTGTFHAVPCATGWYPTQ